MATLQPIGIPEGYEIYNPQMDAAPSAIPEGYEIYNPEAPAENPQPSFASRVVARMMVPPSAKMVDVTKSALLRGVPEGAAAATPLGMGLNIAAGAADLGRWGFGKIAEAVTGEELPRYTPNPIPYSSDVLKAVADPLGGLYEPKTGAGRSASNISAGITGGAITRVPASISVGGAVGSEVAGKAAEGTDYETAARIAGGVLGGVGGGRVADRIARPKLDMKAADIARIANEKFDEAAKVGNVIQPQATNNYVAKARSLLLSGDEKIDNLSANAPLRAVTKDIETFQDEPLSLARAKALDETLSIAAEQHTILGKQNTIAKKIRDAQFELRRMIDKDLDTPALREARAAWKAKINLEDIERIKANADLMDTPAQRKTAIQAGFRTLLRNPNKARWYSKAEIGVLKRAASSGTTSRLLGVFGSSWTSGGLGATIGAAVGGPAGAATGFATANAAALSVRKARESMQRGRMMGAARKVAEPFAPKGPPPALSVAKERISGLAIGMPEWPASIPRPERSRTRITITKKPSQE